ncbi:MAG: polyprenyl synthetase family protein [Planctomycetes bacterium]|nr:polyprenyl synthetase family protein [Planctomycetota bacterium]
MSALKERLAAIRGEVEDALARFLPSAEGDLTRLHEAYRYSSLEGGKRVRPALALLACEAAGGEPSHALAAGCAVELIHVYSLVHDDLPAMDDDDLRRGRPTNHKVYGDAIAILVGDGLQTQAFELLVREYGEDPALALDLVRLLGEGARKMVYGQAIDMAAPEHFPKEEAALEELHRHKTGALLRASVLLGARVAGLRPGEARYEALDTYSQALGLAFQVADDILDCTADTATLGKTAGKDVEQGKLTYVALLGLDGARAKAKALEVQACSALNEFGEAAETLRALAHYVVSREA